MSHPERILVALSGGVDSSVAALLLKQQGFDVAGAYMKNWINEENVIGDCPWQQDIEDAAAVADHLGIPFQVVNLMRDYRSRVVDPLIEGYSGGLTPNPDVLCNREMKFGVFLDWAREREFDAVATGHYARRIDDSGRLSLLEGVDPDKDQTYFLALLRGDQLCDARFPVGHLRKPELRRLAREAGLPTAGKKDSQGICFIGEVKMRDFLRHFVPDRPGPVIEAEGGRLLGEHRGLHLFTLGQRRGIGIPSNTDNRNFVVVGKRSADNALLVAFDSTTAPGLHRTEIGVHSLSWIGEPVADNARLEGRVRHRDPRVPLVFSPQQDGSAVVRFDQPQRALAAGQILALYDEERLLGGGIFGT
jgi:tRNA-specific 2-thiouridylase